MSWKLTAGLLRDAWLAYASTRRTLAAVPSGPPIFLTGTHRSGTTWLAKMLAASGIWYVHEPFNPNKRRWSEAFTYRRPDMRDERVDALMQDVLGGGFRAALNLPHAAHPWMPLRLLNPQMSRMMVKDPLACLLTAYLTRRFSLQTLILFRHPAGFVSSVSRLGWPRGEFLRRFLADEMLMDDHLAPYRALIEKHANEDTIASAAVLHGALTAVLWRFAQDGVGRPLQFETLCADPVGQCALLFRDIGLPYNENVRLQHVRLCHGEARPTGSYHPHAVVRNSMAMTDSWRHQLPRADVRTVRDVWERFNVPLYRDDADWLFATVDAPIAEDAPAYAHDGRPDPQTDGTASRWVRDR